jgi:hypothetical protein
MLFVAFAANAAAVSLVEGHDKDDMNVRAPSCT